MRRTTKWFSACFIVTTHLKEPARPSMYTVDHNWIPNHKSCGLVFSYGQQCTLAGSFRWSVTIHGKRYELFILLFRKQLDIQMRETLNQFLKKLTKFNSITWSIVNLCQIFHEYVTCYNGWFWKVLENVQVVYWISYACLPDISLSLIFKFVHNSITFSLIPLYP